MPTSVSVVQGGEPVLTGLRRPKSCTVVLPEVMTADASCHVKNLTTHLRMFYNLKTALYRTKAKHTPEPRRRHRYDVR